MKFLLDTHIWVWALLHPERLSSAVVQALAAKNNELWLSPISVWETLLLAEKGRLTLTPSPEQWVRQALTQTPIKQAHLTHEVAISSRTLQLPHQDPADRFIAATAFVYHLTLITADQRIGSSRDIALLIN